MYGLYKNQIGSKGFVETSLKYAKNTHKKKNEETLMRYTLPPCDRIENTSLFMAIVETVNTNINNGGSLGIQHAA